MITICQTLTKEVSSEEELTPIDLLYQFSVMLKQKINDRVKVLTKAEQNRLSKLYHSCENWIDVDTQYLEENEIS